MNSTVLVVEDDAAFRAALCDTLAMGGYTPVAADDGDTALDLFQSGAVDLVVSDVQMRRMNGHALLKRLKSQRPNVPVLLMTGFGTIENAVRAMQDGAADYLVKPFESEVLISKVSQLMPAAAIEAGHVANDPRSRQVFDLAQRIADADATVLLTGESGTGKEVLFRHIHANSRRSAGPAIAVNCAAIPENMLEAILFGYEKGAFTGAYKTCPGKFEQAQGGTLLLDEVSEMSMPLQAKLLRVLQEREVERLGGTRVTKLDVRVIATSNRDLRREVAEGRFREDLYYRLNVFPIQVPALRERPQDIVPLAQFLLARSARAAGIAEPPLTAQAQARLAQHPWPGNVRELDNVLQRALLIRTAEAIDADDLHFDAIGACAGAAPAAGMTAPPLPDGLNDDLRAHEARLIVDALREGNGSRKFAAGKLGLSPRTLRYKIARLREAGFQVP
ncbi:MAG: sigma-54-dependent transcriptional regulator [Gammaproteobacteria bacterium]